jgi:protein-tyrosine phosphatase
VLGEFGRLVRRVDAAALPPTGGGAAGVHARGVALVAAADAARAGEHPRPGDDLDDPWGRDASYFTLTADEIATSVDALVAALLPA